jgi:hypothetical protein
MPLYTPRGLKPRISKDYAFGLMARLHGKETALRALQLTEDVENLASLGATIAVSIALYYHATPSQLAIACFVTEVGLKLVHYAGLIVPPISFLLPVSRVFSVVGGYGLMLITLSVICYLGGGWPLVFAMLGARVAAALVGAVLEIFYMKWMKKSLGFPFTGSERSFSTPTDCLRPSMAYRSRRACWRKAKTGSL